MICLPSVARGGSILFPFVSSRGAKATKQSRSGEDVRLLHFVRNDNPHAICLFHHVLLISLAVMLLVGKYYANKPAWEWFLIIHFKTVYRYSRIG